MTPNPLWVVKLGGSLETEPCLRHWLDALAHEGAGHAVIVPGGGRFADAVRDAQAHWQFDEHTAHEMAIGAMQQFGRMLCALQPSCVEAHSHHEIDHALVHGETPVWMPLSWLELEHDIPASWEVTSDSLAAWLAARVGATHLALVKCAEPATLRGTVQQWARNGVVDRYFPSQVAEANFAIRLLHKDQFEEVRAGLCRSCSTQ